ncbi:MAG: hypothetical protein IPJ62_10915 [Betaproteobacteria bacterium]|nr:hypothetical protein [Betaproteobacteria bacterium]
MSPPGRPKSEHRSAQREGAPVTRIDRVAVWTGDLDPDGNRVEIPA